jgi:FkbM family methyltransferase
MQYVRCTWPTEVKRFVPKPVKLVLKWLYSCATWDQFLNRSWSQEGEDRILSRIFENQKSGFYIDVGAHHPKRFSNTYLFYNRGWRGVNIDAMPGSMRAFNEARPRDINLEIGIGQARGKLDYYVFNEPALNSFSHDLSHERDISNSSYRVEKIIQVGVCPLREILDQCLPIGQSVDFMSIDVEGLDLEVLKSNDWGKYRPTYVLVEILTSSLSEISHSQVGMFMNDNNYVLYAKTKNTVFFQDSYQS